MTSGILDYDGNMYQEWTLTFGIQDNLLPCDLLRIQVRKQNQKTKPKKLRLFFLSASHFLARQIRSLIKTGSGQNTTESEDKPEVAAFATQNNSLLCAAPPCKGYYSSMNFVLLGFVVRSLLRAIQPSRCQEQNNVSASACLRI
jgi:hypothetical protein